MNARFYVYKNDETLGPYTREEIEGRLIAGNFTPEDFFWCAGMPTRLPLSKMGKQITPPESMPQSLGGPSSIELSEVQTRLSVSMDKLLMIGGVIFLLYFCLIFDSSVATDAGYRVNNLGLMQERTLGCVISVGAVIIGVILRNAKKALTQ